MQREMVGGRRVVSPAFIGRNDELARVASAAAAPPSVVVIEGEAGIGKSRLVTELTAHPELGGRPMLVGRCHRIRESFPLGPVIEAVRGLGSHLTEVPVPPVTGALRPLLPELADVLPPAPEPLDDRAAERHRVFRGFVAILDAAGPAVLVLEDLHWADEQTIDFVAYTLSEAPAELSVVLTYRGEDVAPAVRSLVASLPATTGRTHVTLGLLDETDTGALAASIVGADRISGEFSRYLRERTSGLPLAVEEMVALLQARGALVRRGGRWSRRSLEELDVPTGIRDSVLERVGRVSATARAIIEAASVLHVPVPFAVLSATSQLPRETGLQALQEALESALLVESRDRERVGFRHVLAAQAVYEGVPGPVRRDLHRRAAASLRELDHVPLGQLAHHLRHSGQLDDWVVAAEEAARQARSVGNDAQACRLLEDVLLHAPLDPERRGRLAITLGQAAIEALRARDVVGLLAEVLEEELPSQVRGELRFQLGTMLHEIGEEPDQIRRLLISAVDELDDRPKLQARAMVVLGFPTANGIPLTEHRSWLQRALRTLERIDDPDFEVFLLGKVAMVLTPIGDREWVQLLARIEEKTGGTPTNRWEVNAYASVGTEACYAGHHEAAERLLTAALEGAVAEENTRLELSVRSALAVLRYCCGQWDGLRAEVDHLVAELAGHPRAGIDVEMLAGCLALVHGRSDDAHTLLTAAADHGMELGSFDVLPIAMAALLRHLLARDDVAAAVTEVERYLAVVGSKGIWAPDVRVLPVATEVLVAAGEATEAERLVATWTHDLEQLDAPLAPACLLHADGIVRLATGQRPDAVRSLTAAASAYEMLLCPYEAAMTQERAAAALLAAGGGSVADGGKLLRRAVTAFRRLGATSDTDRATSSAREHGVSVPARHRGGRRGYGNELSPREREVAELAATGRSNKQIASELFLSVNTVARHVTAAMRKLDIHSRAALAHRLAEVDRA